ncbi:hypothetical protein, partial [Aeromonas dhakensis]|uniref:hypothetical protein n=1 Tax=Aeromonas dhakensis TaxID=196024 RepID=UPI001A8D28E2
FLKVGGDDRGGPLSLYSTLYVLYVKRILFGINIKRQPSQQAARQRLYWLHAIRVGFHVNCFKQEI